MWNLVEPQLLRMEPVCGTSRKLAKPGARFRAAAPNTPKLYWKNPKPFRLLGKNNASTPFRSALLLFCLRWLRWAPPEELPEEEGIPTAKPVAKKATGRSVVGRRVGRETEPVPFKKEGCLGKKVGKSKKDRGKERVYMLYMKCFYVLTLCLL